MDVEERRKGNSKNPELARRLILEAALKRFSEVGYRGTRMSDVARAAGYSEATVFHHFGTKADVFREVVSRIDAESPWFSEEATAEELIEHMHDGELRYHRDGRWRALDRVWSEALSGEEDLLRMIRPALEGSLSSLDQLLARFDTTGHPHRALLARWLMAVSYGARVLRRYDADAISPEESAALLRYTTEVALAALRGEGPEIVVRGVGESG